MNKKILRLICLIIVTMLALSVLTACPPEGGKGTLYIIEAESMDLTEFQGLAQSGSPKGADCILGVNKNNDNKACVESLNKKTADNKAYNDGYFLGFFNGVNNNFTFTFESDANAKATFSLRLGSEFGSNEFNKNNLTIKVNGTAIDYKAFKVSGPAKDWGAFKDYAINVEIDLRKNDPTGKNFEIKDGEGTVKISKPILVQNTIEIILGDNKYWGGTSYAGGFGIDCLKLTTTAKVTWDDYWVGGWAYDWDTDKDTAMLLVGNKDLIG